MRKVIYNRVARRKKRISAMIVGSKERPRISVYRSNKYIYVQAIDDMARITVAASSSKQIKKEKSSMKKSEEAKQVGIILAQKMKELKIEAGVFDRGRYAYNGRVKLLAEGLREGGLKI